MRTLKFALLVALFGLATNASAQFVNSSSGSSRSSSSVGSSLTSVTTDGWSRVSVSYLPSKMKSEGESESFNGFSIGYLKGFSVTNRLPLYVEAGAALQYRSHKEEGNYGGPGYDYSDKHKMFSLNIPVNLLYRFNVTDDFSVSPYFGLDFRINLTGKYSWEEGMGQYNDPQGEELNLFDEDEMGKNGVWKRFQAGWHIGVGLDYRAIHFGVSYGKDFNEICKDCKLATTSVAVGFNF